LLFILSNVPQISKYCGDPSLSIFISSISIDSADSPLFVHSYTIVICVVPSPLLLLLDEDAVFTDCDEDEDEDEDTVDPEENEDPRLLLELEDSCAVDELLDELLDELDVMPRELEDELDVDSVDP